MAGGKGKSSGGKTSGGKAGLDGNKKQQSHSSKAGLQVSIAQLHYQLLRIICDVFPWNRGPWDESADHLRQPRQVASKCAQQQQILG